MYKLIGGLLIVLTFFWTGSVVTILIVYSPLVASQVFQCKDPVTGKMTFTDLACPDKNPGAHLHVKPANVDSGYPSAEERRQSRHSPSYSGQSNNIVVVEDSGIRREPRIQPAPRIQPEPRMSDRRSSVASRSDRGEQAGRGAQDAPFIDRPEIEPPSHPIPQSRPTIVNPDPAGAWDTNGTRYNKGAGNTYHRTDGKTCQLLNTGMQCN